MREKVLGIREGSKSHLGGSCIKYGGMLLKGR